MRKSFLLLLIFLVVSSFMGTSLAGVTMSGEGTMSSIEEDGSIIIDEMGYMVDKKVAVSDSANKRISLRRLSPPVRIYFEYEYTKKGPVIKLIKEIPKEMPR